MLTKKQASEQADNLYDKAVESLETKIDGHLSKGLLDFKIRTNSRVENMALQNLLDGYMSKDWKVTIFDGEGVKLDNVSRTGWYRLVFK